MFEPPTSPSSELTVVINVAPGTIPCGLGKVASNVANASKGTISPAVIGAVVNSDIVTELTSDKLSPAILVPVTVAVVIAPVLAPVTVTTASFAGVAPPNAVPSIVILLPTL